MMAALSTAADRVRAGQADDAITRWFGAATLAERAGLAATISRFRANINIKKIVIGFEVLQKNPDFDASKWATYKAEKAAWKLNPALPEPAQPEPAMIRDGANAAAYRSPDQNVSLDLGNMLSHVPKRPGEVPVELGTEMSRWPTARRLTVPSVPPNWHWRIRPRH
jgi:hypothetical protein